MTDAKQLTTTELLAELRRRDAEPATPLVAVRKLLVDTCNAVGFPRPAPSHGLAEWADECLDSLLGRGSKAWIDAHDLVIDALDAALLKNAPLVTDLLTRARDIARAEGARKCECEKPLFRMADTLHSNPATCLRCRLKRA